MRFYWKIAVKTLVKKKKKICLSKDREIDEVSAKKSAKKSQFSSKHREIDSNFVKGSQKTRFSSKDCGKSMIFVEWFRQKTQISSENHGKNAIFVKIYF